ncbi:MAG: hypothetical protein E7Z92_05160 [Cyanobacteria bacterium SIG31]|nr:hypothetical protein [Cyanobacteria bacterium SIG31]
MEQQNLNYYCPADELDEELTIDLKKIALAIWSRKELIVKVFASVLAFFILMTFISAKKYVVDADLYINKSNNSNFVDLNPYAIAELGAAGGMAALMSGSGNLTNELELMQSPLVIDRVIKENDLKFKKVYGIFPTKKTGQYLTTQAFLKKGITFENKKGTNVVTISYKSKDKELAYNVVSSIISNYVQLQKELNAEKSKSDKRIIEKSYNQAKEDLKKSVDNVSGLPEQAFMQTANISAMSAFSSSAQSAMGQLRSQLIEGHKSKIAVTEEAAKVAELSKRLEWAKLVEEMSDSSKVVVLKAPRLLKDYEQASPKLFTNIILGIVFGVIASLIAVIYKEITDKKLAYSMLGDNIIYSVEKDYINLKRALLTNQNKNITLVAFEKLPTSLVKNLKEFKNLNMVQADISSNFVSGIENSTDLIIIASINQTDAELYKQVKQMLNEMNKNILREVLV